MRGGITAASDAATQEQTWSQGLSKIGSGRGWTQASGRILPALTETSFFHRLGSCPVLATTLLQLLFASALLPLHVA